MGQIAVLVADDDPVTRDGLVAILEAQPGIAVIGEAVNGNELMAKTKELQPDVVLIDFARSKPDALDTTREIKMAFPQTRVIFLSVYSTHLGEALAAGASRFMLKDCRPADLVAAILE